jgi:hypothetical protein
MLIRSGFSVASARCRASTRSASVTSPLPVNGFSTRTSAAGATQRSTPAMNVPWPPYRSITPPWTPASGSPVTPCSQPLVTPAW